MKRIITDINELTPVDVFENIGPFKKVYFKRDDLYHPYPDIPWLSGGKLKQSISLFETMKDELNKYDGIMTYIQCDSPQGIIISRVAKEFGFKAAITIGVEDLDKSIKLHKSLQLCKKMGAELIPLGSCRSNKVLYIKTKPIAEKRNYYIIYFGINIDSNPEALTEKISQQVKNIPDKLDILAVSVGSGIQLAAILHGIKKYDKKIDRILGIQISGYDRSKDINAILDKLGIPDMKTKYEQIIDKTYNYSKHVEITIKDRNNFRNTIRLNPVYESKGWSYLCKHVKELNIDKKAELLYWVIGDNSENYG